MTQHSPASDTPREADASSEHHAPRSRRFRKVAALAAGGALVVGGLGYTVAAWTDSEWVYAGDGAGGPGIGTGTFEVQQSVTSPYTAGFADFEANPGQAMLFTPGAQTLSPGESVYAGVALRTTATTTVPADVQVRAAVPATGVAVADAGGTLFAALTVRVATVVVPATGAAPTCTAAAFTAPTTIGTGPLASTGATGTQRLAAGSGTTQFYCFEVTLPQSAATAASSTLQGRTVAPAWEFASTSVE
ncbi:acyl-CoA dehydrogenase [Frigoribacterium sp. VKM Ac-2836]|uniref:acyl-CoA dehydrogenase n=1 Tax=Frigoribacterium sp. VKM Ac-2836 TaxID=2739014 RepID=UPI0020B7872D|nr:acyl-CoA dehydrogenase [Frigoribacterium sp. VKM Ac-2836]